MQVFSNLSTGLVLSIAPPMKDGVMAGEGRSFDLRPGVNEVPDDFWTAWSKENTGYGPVVAGHVPTAPAPAESPPTVEDTKPAEAETAQAKLATAPAEVKSA